MTRVIIPLLALSLMVATACADAKTPPRQTGSVASSVSTEIDPPVAALSVALAAPEPPPSPPLALVYCADASSSYPASLLERARGAVAALLEQHVQPGFGSAKVWGRWITDASRADTATLTTFQVSAAPAPPTRPADPPKPAPPDLSSIEYKFNKQARDAAEQQYAKDLQAWDAGVARRDREYQQALIANAESLATARNQMLAGADTLRHAPLPPALGSDIGGCLQRGGDLLSRQSGDRYLVLSTDMEPFGFQDATTFPLAGVKVRVIYFHCSRAVDCDHWRGYWTPILLTAGAASVEWYTPDEDLGTLFR